MAYSDTLTNLELAKEIKIHMKYTYKMPSAQYLLEVLIKRLKDDDNGL